MIIELEINGARVIVSGENLTVSVTGEDQPKVKPFGVAAVSESVGIAALKEWLSERRGRARQLAIDLGVTHAAIPQWREVPADRLLAVESLTGIPRQQLRPDLYAGMTAA